MLANLCTHGMFLCSFEFVFGIIFGCGLAIAIVILLVTVAFLGIDSLYSIDHKENKE